MNQWRLAAVLICVVLLAIPYAFGAESSASPSSAAVTLGMPFAGQWAYNAPVSPPYVNECPNGQSRCPGLSSHPSVHTPSAKTGQWATDLYAKRHRDVTLVLSAKGTIRLSARSNWDSCGPGVAGKGVAYNVSLDGRYLGWVSFAHLDAPKLDPPDVYQEPFVVGAITDEPLKKGCFETPHVHLELGTDKPAPFSCWKDIGAVGRTVPQGEVIAQLGSSNAVAGKACPADTPQPPTTKPPAVAAPSVIPIGKFTAYDVSCVSASECWVVGSQYVGRGDKAIVARLRGKRWTSVPVPRLARYTLPIAIECVSPSNCWLGGVKSPDANLVGPPFLMQWNGSKWTEVSAPEPLRGRPLSELYGLFDITCPSANHCFAVGGALDGSSADGLSYVLESDGGQWRRTGPSSFVDPAPAFDVGEKLGSLGCAKVPLCVAVGPLASYALWDGAGWSQHASADLSGVDCLPTICIAAGPGAVYKVDKISLTRIGRTGSDPYPDVYCSASSCWVSARPTLYTVRGGRITGSQPQKRVLGVTGFTAGDCYRNGCLLVSGKSPVNEQTWFARVSG